MEHKDSTIPFSIVIIAMAILPIIFFYTFYIRYEKHTRIDLKNLAYFYIKYLLGVGSVLFITEVLKVSVGRHRPDYFSRCKPDPSDKKICTGDPDIINEGRKSFPSGHSSSSFYLMSYLSLFYLFNRHERRIQPHLFLLVVFSYLTAALVAVTRLQNNKHHPTDILFGSLIGILFSFLVVKYI